MTLDEIAIKHGTDKATTHPVKGHGYSPHYARFFEELRNSPIKFLEIGVGGGESIRTWLEYFTKAQVFGVDMVENTNPWNSPKEKPHERYTFFQGTQESETFWSCFCANYGTDWDIVIDDGGHCSDQIITTHKCLWPHLKSGGLFCIEDLCTAYGGPPFVPAGWQNHLDYIKDMLDHINQRENQIESIHFSCELAIIKKS
jgi:hypothetical protein